uniref:(northern house mosquito) hypothetical protein n=1 Tax=Culex pipiens TaxID=7175 RepID=A0A8D8K8N9_CULPI
MHWVEIVIGIRRHVSYFFSCVVNFSGPAVRVALIRMILPPFSNEAAISCSCPSTSSTKIIWLPDRHRDHNRLDRFFSSHIITTLHTQVLHQRSNEGIAGTTVLFAVTTCCCRRCMYVRQSFHKLILPLSPTG